MSEVTIYDVAALAGVSIATVSHTLNRPQRVSAATRDRVLEAIHELQFVPKELAVSRARRGVGRIGVLAPFTSYESYRRRLVGVLREYGGLAKDVVIYDQESAATTASPLLRALPSTGRLDGLLLMGLPLDEMLVKELAARRMPTVVVDSTSRTFSSVNIRDEDGGAMAAAHLLASGRRTFAFVGEAQQSDVYVSQAQRRRSSFVAVLGENGIPAGAVQDIAVTGDYAGGRQAAAILREAGELPAAVFAHHDAIAAGLVAGLRDLGIDVPGQVAVIGFDDGEVAEAIGLTTVQQPFEESGRVGVRLLADAMEAGDRPAQHIELGLRLVVRRTA